MGSSEEYLKLLNEALAASSTVDKTDRLFLTRRINGVECYQLWWKNGGGRDMIEKNGPWDGQSEKKGKTPLATWEWKGEVLPSPDFFPVKEEKVDEKPPRIAV